MMAGLTAPVVAPRQARGTGVSAAELQRMYEDSIRRRDERGLPKSTVDTIDWLLKYGDEQRLRGFLEGRSEEELQRIERYVSGKMSR